MAAYHEVPQISKVRAKLRSKEYMYAILAALLVLAYILHASDNAKKTHPVPPASVSETEQLSLLGDVQTADTTMSSPASAKLGSLISEDGWETDTAVGSPVPAPFSSSSSSSLSSQAGGHSGMTNTNNNNKALAPEPPAADRLQAIIIESDMVPNLVPLMLHFATVLGPSWGMLLFTLRERWVSPRSPAFERLQASGRLQVRFLPAGTDLGSSAAVSRFLTGPWLWEQLEAAPRVLLFQSDSVLCAKSEARVEDYLGYDLVGAPIAPVYGDGYNGGLSLRNPRLFLQIVRETDFATSGEKFEDQFFYNELKKRGASLPSPDVAKTFSVETVYYETPLGYHQPQRWQEEHMDTIEEWCPEVKMLIGRRAW